MSEGGPGAVYSPRQQELARRINPEVLITNWRDWKWHIRNSIRDIDTFERLLDISLKPAEREALEATVRKFPLSVTPYYLSLIDPERYDQDPVFRQAFPSPSELIIENYDMVDPLAEDRDSPVPGITHRYPDRVLFHVSNVCSMYCRHCTRKRKVGDRDSIPGKDDISQGIDYIRKNPVVRDVLLSGGDPLMLSTDYLDWILTEVRAIPHVEIVRIGSRMPVVLPYRITDNLVTMLRKHHPLWLNTHFNHPREITTSAKEALAKLADAGIPLGNQSVLLAGVNDCPRIMTALVHKLVKNRVRPYYLYQCDLAEGLTHFRTPISKGIEILESMIGHTTGFAIPTYVVDAPGGGGKVPVQPTYLISMATNKMVFRNYEGVITTYKEPDSYEAVACDRNCKTCKLWLDLQEGKEDRAIGIARLLSSQDGTISLTPRNLEKSWQAGGGEEAS